ncbi:MAG: DUF4870 domain-containing protein [bacterium]|nr:DUF4870 domain-containing protein [bacterium]
MQDLTNHLQQASSPAQHLSKDEITWATLCHLAALAGFIIPFGNLLGPLVVWLVKKNEFPFVDEQGKEALNFQILVTIALLLASLTLFICVGVVLVPAVAIAALIFVIVAAVRVSNGENYRYPINWRVIK